MHALTAAGIQNVGKRPKIALIQFRVNQSDFVFTRNEMLDLLAVSHGVKLVYL